MTRSQVMSGHARAARLAHFAEPRLAAGPQPVDGVGERLGRRLADESRLPVRHELEDSPGIVRRHHGLAREERLHRDVAVVLVHGRVERRTAARRRGRAAPRWRRSPRARRGRRAPRPSICFSSSGPSGPSPAITRRARLRHALHGVDEQGSPASGGRAAPRRGGSRRTRRSGTGRGAAAEGRAPRPRARCSVSSRRATFFEIVKTRRHSPRPRRVHRANRLAHLAVLRRVAEGAELGPPEVVGLAVLVEEPRHLARVPDEIARELRGDHEIDANAVALLDVEQAPGEGLPRDLGHRVPPERERSRRRPETRAGAAASRSSAARISAPPTTKGAWTAHTRTVFIRRRAASRAPRAGPERPGAPERGPSATLSASESTRSMRLTRSWVCLTSSS